MLSTLTQKTRFTLPITAVLFTVFSSLCAAQQIYKVKKENGDIVFTDMPAANAEVVELDTINTVAMPVTKPAPMKRVVTSSLPTNLVLTIVSPAPEATIRNNNGVVKIQAKLSDNAKGRYELLLNDQVIEQNSTGVFSLKNLDRGAYQFSVRFIDNTGKTLALTQQQTFYLHKASALISPK